MPTVYKQEISLTYAVFIQSLDDKDFDFTPMENEAAFQMQEYAENELKIENADNYCVSAELHEMDEIEVTMKFNAHFDFKCGGNNYDEPRWFDCNNEVAEEDFSKIEKNFEEIIKKSMESQGLIVREVSLADNDSQTYEEAMQDKYEKRCLHEKD